MKVFLVLCLAILVGAFPRSSPADEPKLVVAIVVDQLRTDYLERFHDQFSPGGFRLLTDQGAFLTFAHYNYAPTVTGPGHASFLSGAPPAVHGIIGNDWFDKRTQKKINCVSDPGVQGVGADPKSGQRSPRNFIGSTFADEMRLRFHSKVVGVAIKDRGAILPAGKRPAGAYWFDSVSGRFVTSTYYRPELPEWVKTFNDLQRPAAFVGQTWSRLLEPAAYHWPDQAAGEAALPGAKKVTFDHVVHPSPTEGFENVVITPFGNQLLAEFALAAIDGEKLGTGPHPDLLTVSFSSPDLCGHRFGPYSQEMQDMILRLDRQLAEFFAQLDKRFGLQNVLIVLTADHGVAPTADFAVAEGLDGARLDTTPLFEGLEQQLAERFGAGKFFLLPKPSDNVLYFDHAALRARDLSADAVALFIREWAYASGEYQAAYTRAQLLDGRAPGLIGQRVLNGYHGERSGDVVLVPKPFHLPSAYQNGTTHGSPYSYDTHIPVAFYGAAFQRGRYADEFYITDIAATLSAALRLTAPSGNVGKPFVKALTRQP